MYIYIYISAISCLHAAWKVHDGFTRLDLSTQRRHNVSSHRNVGFTSKKGVFGVGEGRG